MDGTAYVLNGPNLNPLGKRQPEIYGRETLSDVEAACRRAGNELGLAVRFHQVNREYEVIDWMHEAREAAGIVINPPALTYTSVALLDALKTCGCPILEMHNSNVHQQEASRHHAYVSLSATGVIAGFSAQGYTLALPRLEHLIEIAA